MVAGTSVASCKHGLTPELCETCAAWDSAEFNAQLAMEKQRKLDAALADADRLAVALTLCHTQLTLALAHKGYPFLGPLAQPATEVGLRLGSAALAAHEGSAT